MSIDEMNQHNEGARWFHAIRKAIESPDKERVIRLSDEILELEKKIEPHLQLCRLTGANAFERMGGSAYQVFINQICDKENELDEIIENYVAEPEADRTA